MKVEITFETEDDACYRADQGGKLIRVCKHGLYRKADTVNIRLPFTIVMSDERPADGICRPVAGWRVYRYFARMFGKNFYHERTYYWWIEERV